MQQDDCARRRDDPCEEAASFDTIHSKSDQCCREEETHQGTDEMARMKTKLVQHNQNSQKKLT